MKTGLGKPTLTGDKSCTVKALALTDIAISVSNSRKKEQITGDSKPFSERFLKRSAHLLVTVSALYFCVACSEDGVSSSREAQSNTFLDGIPTRDTTVSSAVVTTVGALPVSVSVAIAEESSPIKLASVEVGSTTPIVAEAAVEQEQSVTPVEETPAAATPVEETPAVALPEEEKPAAAPQEEETPAAAIPVEETPAAAPPEEETPAAAIPEAVSTGTDVTDADPAVEPQKVPVFKAISGPLMSGPNVVGVDYPDTSTAWQLDFWVGGAIVNQQNPDGVDQGPSIKQSEGFDGYTVNLPSGVAEVKLYVRYWVEGTTQPTTWVAGENYIETTISITANGADNTDVPAFSPAAGSASSEGQSPVTGTAMSFAEIADDGLQNACYLDDDHYVAEFMYQNPDACFWELDSANQTVSAVATPEPPSDAVQLPAPSGGDDTGALESFINARAGESLVGQGTYKVNGLDINVPVDIFNMPMEPTSGAGEMVLINSPDVRIFSSPIDAKGSSTAYIGFHVKDGSHRFTLVDSGFSNIYHTNNQSAAGVWLRGVDDFHIACNRFENIINDTNDKQYTARANAIWMNGRADTQTTSGGYIVNNYAYNAQSNGKLLDSEFLAIQGYTNTSIDKPVKIYANRTLDAGKRFTKHQEDNAKVLSNDHEWSVTAGPLGNRILLAHVAVQFSDNIIARNNRVTVGANSRFDYMLNTQVQYGTKVQDNIHYDCNDIEIQDQLPANSNSLPMIITARMSTKPRNSTGFEATNSSANFNRVHGAGSVKYFYNFDHGYDGRGGRFETIGNIIEIDLDRVYRFD